MRPKLAAYETWPAIALSYLLCLGLPVAPFLLWRRLRKDRTPRPILAFLLLAFGLLAAGFSILMIFVPSKLEAPPELNVYFALLALAHAALVILGIRAFRNVRKVNRYAELLAAHAPTTVDELAAAWNRSDVQAMVAELDAILASDALPGYRLDAGTRYVERLETGGPVQAGAPQKLTFICPSCGATNEGVAVVGGVAQCEYCERPVRG